MTIRPAVRDDVPRLVELLGFLFAQEEEFAPDRNAQIHGLDAILSSPATGQILVAEEQAVIVGMANLLFTISTALGGRAGILDDLVVDPTRRGIGIGTALLRATIGEAKRQGCLRISLHTDVGNRGARSLYERHGFHSSTLVPYTLPLRCPAADPDLY